VLSIATDFTFRSLSRFAIRINSGVVAPKSATSLPLPSCRRSTHPVSFATYIYPGDPASNYRPALPLCLSLFRIVSAFRTRLPRLADTWILA
jgi:hypothetical protein